MPLLSITVHQDIWPACQEDLTEALPAIRQMLCEKLAVGQEFASLTITPVFGLPDQIKVNGDLRVLGKESRGPEVLQDVAEALQTLLSKAASSHASVRITTMNPATYMAKR
ncbi:hypothetical protein [Donghicola tyrosinivorans]|uniref:5-carboxymethyl-2-hydroxymuconate isomerase n=1 Tax=Donghicola tyrosinivorans TaxID=1652492 RepID=A0A2T0WH46_9RHOB|nr:hypothetical protein [Donghicola tyrosinivorans]PRY86029.1 hypothetical protein CLV74_1134 [Donghicola tyrosinivorans]